MNLPKLFEHQWIRTNLPVVLLGSAAVFVYRAQLHATDTINHFLSLILVQAVLYFLAAWIICRARSASSTLIIVIVFAALFRLSILFSQPYLSDDIYRYIWDGRVQSTGINPYRYVPSDPALTTLQDETIYPEINRSDYAHTIYPPLAQFIYLVVTRVSESVTWMKTAMVGFEALTLWALASLLASFGMARQRILLYAWHPLIVWEIAGSGHVDAVAIAFVSLALLARRRNWETATGIALACATLVKLYPLLLLPALFRRWRWRMPLAFAATLVLAYLPYLSVGLKGVLGFLPDYTNEEGLQNGDRYYALNLMRWLVGETPVPTAFYAVIALSVLAVLALRALFRHQRDPKDYVVNAMLIAATFTTFLSPQYAWYFTWIIPFLCFAVTTAWLPVFYLTTSSFILYRLWVKDLPNLDLLIGTFLFLPTAVLLLAVFLRRRFAPVRRITAFLNEANTSGMNNLKQPVSKEVVTPAFIDSAIAAAHIAVIIPALNEEATIADVVRAVPAEIAAEVIVVDNGSDDLTADRARLAGARVVSEPQRGYGRACRAGVRALSPDCEIVVFLDGDGSDCPELMGKLIKPIIVGAYDFVIGSRTRGNREKGSMNFQQVFAGRIAGWLLRPLYGISYTDMCPFRAIRRDVLDQLGMREETYGWNLEMQMRVARADLRILELPVDHRCRAGGESKVSGTLRGTFLAGTRIILTLARVAVERE